MTATETRTVDVASLAAFRMLFGALLFVAVLRYFWNGWIHAQFIEPELFFTYPGFEWVRPLPGAGVYVHFALIGLAALAIALGLLYRVATVTFFVTFTWVHLIDKTNYLNHYYLVSLVSLLLIFMPLGRAASLDALRQPERAREAIHPWSLRLLRFQVGAVYFLAGVAKLRADWLVDAQPLRIWLAHSEDLPVLGPLLAWPSTAHVFSWAGALFDLCVPFLLLWRRTRLLAFVAVVVFHGLTAALFPIGLFPWFMIAFATVFLDADWPRRLGSKLASLRGLARASRGRAAAPGVRSGGRRDGWPATVSGLPVVARVAIVGWVAVQVLVPFRHWLYRGDVLWTEEGFRFSWMVMLMEKRGRAEFEVEDPATGRTWTVRPSDRLTRVQEHMMSTQPDMILEFAHRLRDEYAALGVSSPIVRADVRVSLNGRASAPLVDSSVDLAAEPRGLAPKRWITSLDAVRLTPPRNPAPSSPARP